LAAQGLLPADWLVADIRSGAKESRDRQSRRNMLRNLAKLAHWKREGYSFDAERRLVAPAPARIHVAPQRDYPGNRPRERRPATRRRARAPTGDDPSPESDPPLRVISHATFARVLRHALGEQA
jgi:hypothetical protein